MWGVPALWPSTWTRSLHGRLGPMASDASGMCRWGQPDRLALAEMPSLSCSLMLWEEPGAQQGPGSMRAWCVSGDCIRPPFCWQQVAHPHGSSLSSSAGLSKYQGTFQPLQKSRLPHGDVPRNFLSSCAKLEAAHCVPCYSARHTWGHLARLARLLWS